MSSQAWWLVAFLLGGAVVVVWPVGVARRRWSTRDVDVPRPAMRIRALTVRREAMRQPRRAVLATAIVCGVGGWILAGPVAALAVGTYAGLGARSVLRRWSTRERAASRARALDEVGALAADLRAGLPPTGQAGPGSPGSGAPGPAIAAAPTADDARLRELVAAAWRLAERTGAPVADLVDRIEADARAADRGRASAAAQAAGARATALLLAGLPVGGIALGYTIGVDPLHILLHTPLGAACVGAALLLQVGGLAWADRLAGSGAVR